MHIGPTEILDTYAEAFALATRGSSSRPSTTIGSTRPLRAITGYGTSVIGCDCRSRRRADARARRNARRPAGRGRAVLRVHGREARRRRWPTASASASSPAPPPPASTACRTPRKPTPLGKYLRYFGDGFEEQGSRESEPESRLSTLDSSTRSGGFPSWTANSSSSDRRRRKALPAATSSSKPSRKQAALAAAQRAAGAVAPLAGVITPFPGGVCRSGSKVGSKYKDLVASTAEAYCPTLRERVASQAGRRCQLRLRNRHRRRRPAGRARRRCGPPSKRPPATGVLAIGAGNYGGKLGKYPIRLHELFAQRDIRIDVIAAQADRAPIRRRRDCRPRRPPARLLAVCR